MISARQQHIPVIGRCRCGGRGASICNPVGVQGRKIQLQPVGSFPAYSVVQVVIGLLGTIGKLLGLLEAANCAIVG